jgi:hypothetical protein
LVVISFGANFSLAFSIGSTTAVVCDVDFLVLDADFHYFLMTG